MTQGTPTAPAADLRLQRSSRDAASAPAALAGWLAPFLPDGADPRVVLHAGADANGMSSETLVLDATWSDPSAPGGRQQGRYVARVEPSVSDFPVFPRYDLAAQHEVMRLVGELTDVPVPTVGLLEPTGVVLGTPFFLMDRVDGLVPPDVLPYTFGDNWLFDAEPADQRRLQDSSVEVLARLHGIPDAASRFAFLDPGRHGATGVTPLARNLAATREWYEFALRDVGRSSLAERALTWLEANLPPPDGDPVLCWGDARIGNVMYDDFTPVAVLDWEMATLGPRELDVAWLVFAHQVFESIAAALELPGMPHFLREDDVRATYEGLTATTLGDLTWYRVYHGLVWCIVFMRTGARQIHFGEIEPPDEVEALFHCRPLVERLLDDVGA